MFALEVGSKILQRPFMTGDKKQVVVVDGKEPGQFQADAAGSPGYDGGGHAVPFIYRAR